MTDLEKILGAIGNLDKKVSEMKKGIIDSETICARFESIDEDISLLKEKISDLADDYSELKNTQDDMDYRLHVIEVNIRRKNLFGWEFDQLTFSSKC